MFISVTNKDGTRTFAAELSAVFIEHGYNCRPKCQVLRIYGKNEGVYCIAYFKTIESCEDKMAMITHAMQTGALYVEFTADDLSTV